jgi:hypothetical protein
LNEKKMMAAPSVQNADGQSPRPLRLRGANLDRGEIFLTNGKINTDSDTVARDSAAVASIAMQFGADVETLRGALLRDARGAPSGPLGVALDIINIKEKQNDNV